MENICDLISQKRKDLGLTQSDLGAMLGRRFPSGNEDCQSPVTSI